MYYGCVYNFLNSKNAKVIGEQWEEDGRFDDDHFDYHYLPQTNDRSHQHRIQWDRNFPIYVKMYAKNVLTKKETQSRPPGDFNAFLSI